ncbi:MULTISPECIES: RNA polymerase sigma factor [Chitinophagaceae]
MFEIDETNDEQALLGALQVAGTALAAFNRIFDRYHVAVYRNAERILQDAILAEDIVQESFILLWQKRDLLAPDTNLAGWLFRVSYHKAIDVIRQKSLTVTLVDRDVEDCLGLELAEQDYEALEAAIAQLSPQKRKVVELCKFKGYSYKEAATEMGISRFTVNEYLKESMAFLKQHIGTRAHCIYWLVLLLTTTTGNK